MFCIRLIMRFIFWAKMSFLYFPNCFMKFSFDRCGEKENWFCKNGMHEWKIYASCGTAYYPFMRCCQCNESPKDEYEPKFNFISLMGLVFWIFTCPIWIPILFWCLFVDLCELFFGGEDK